MTDGHVRACFGPATFRLNITRSRVEIWTPI